jgi:hypothetical protein
MTAEVVFPIVHGNGTSVDELVRQRRDAMKALREAGEALRAMYPNGRDYYVGEPGRYAAAVSQHESRLADIERLYRSVEAELIATTRPR